MNPVFLTKAILGKVIGLLTSDDQGDAESGFVALLKDVIIGIIMGVVGMSVLIFLDHRNVIHFQSAHHFRDAAFGLLQDPETMATIEESSDLKFITASEYEYYKSTIDGVAEKIKSSEEALEKRSEELEKNTKEIESLKGEHEEMLKDPRLGLDKFCETCPWGNTNCAARVKYMEDTYKLKPFRAKIDVMKAAPGCKSD